MFLFKVFIRKQNKRATYKKNCISSSKMEALSSFSKKSQIYEEISVHITNTNMEFHGNDENWLRISITYFLCWVICHFSFIRLVENFYYLH